MKREADIQREVIAYLRARGHNVRKLHLGGMRARGKGGSGWAKNEMAGFPDLLVLLPEGRTMWIEVKQPGKSPSESQVTRHRELRALGHTVVVAASVEDVRAYLEPRREPA